MTAAGPQDGRQTIPLFETPLIIDTVPGADELNCELRQIVVDRRSHDDGVHKSNWNGWQSATDMMEWGGDPAGHLADHFLAICNGITSLPPGQRANFLWSVDMWANISAAGASNEAHVHPGVVWSGVYWVDDGAGDADPAKLGGELTLYDPRMPAVRMLPYDMRYRRPDGEVAHSQYVVRPVPGKIVVFPPWLLHSVHPHQGEGERISIAMNVTAIPAR